MFEGKTLWQILSMGGFTMYVLLFCSVLSIGVIIERLLQYFSKSRLDRDKFMKEITIEVSRGNLGKAVALCESEEAPIARVAHAGLHKAGREEKEISSAMEREIMVQTVLLERHTSIVGTIGNIAVYIGLFGTVLGIVRSFHNISQIGSGGITVVIGGVSEALLATATGLCVAIPAVVAYNYFVRRVDNFITDMEYVASQTADILTEKKGS